MREPTVTLKINGRVETNGFNAVLERLPEAGEFMAMVTGAVAGYQLFTVEFKDVPVSKAGDILALFQGDNFDA